MSGTPSPLWAQLDAVLNAYGSSETLIYAGVIQTRGRNPSKRETEQRNAPAAFLNAVNNVRLRAALTVADKSAHGISFETEETSFNDEVGFYLHFAKPATA